MSNNKAAKTKKDLLLFVEKFSSLPAADKVNAKELYSRLSKALK